MRPLAATDTRFAASAANTSVGLASVITPPSAFRSSLVERISTPQTTAVTTSIALSAMRRRGRSSPASSEIGHELDALLLAGLEDPRQRLHRLRPVVAVAGAVGVVQEQDRPGVEPRHAAVDDPLDAGLGRVPDARRPAHHAVAEAARDRHQERAAKAVGGAEQRRRGGAGRAHDRLVQRAQLVGDPGRPLEGEQPSGRRRGWPARGPRPRSGGRSRGARARGGPARRRWPCARRPRPARRGSAA